MNRICLHVQDYSEVTTLCFAVWGAMCGYIRTIPKFTYAANVAAFSTGIIVFSVRTEPSGDAAVPVLARIQQVRCRGCQLFWTPQRFTGLECCRLSWFPLWHVLCLQTIFGVAIYLVVTNIVFPQRASVSVRRDQLFMYVVRLPLIHCLWLCMLQCHKALVGSLSAIQETLCLLCDRIETLLDTCEAVPDVTSPNLQALEAMVVAVRDMALEGANEVSLWQRPFQSVRCVLCGRGRVSSPLHSALRLAV